MERSAALTLVTREPGTWPPSATGRGRGPQDASYRAAMTQQIVGGYGVSVSERSSPVPCVSRSAEWSEAARQPNGLHESWAMASHGCG